MELIVINISKENNMNINKQKQVNCRLTEYHFDQVSNISEHNFMKVSAWVRQVIIDKLKEIKKGER